MEGSQREEKANKPKVIDLVLQSRSCYASAVSSTSNNRATVDYESKYDVMYFIFPNKTMNQQNKLTTS